VGFGRNLLKVLANRKMEGQIGRGNFFGKGWGKNKVAKKN